MCKKNAMPWKPEQSALQDFKTKRQTSMNFASAFNHVSSRSFSPKAFAFWGKILGLFLALQITTFAAINPALYLEEATDVVKARVIAVTSLKDDSNTTRVSVLLEIDSVEKSGAKLKAKTTICVQYVSDSKDIKKAAAAHASMTKKEGWVGPQLLTPPATPELDAKGTFYLRPIKDAKGDRFFEPASHQYSFEIEK